MCTLWIATPLVIVAFLNANAAVAGYSRRTRKMELRKKALVLMSASALMLSLSAGSVFAQDSAPSGGSFTVTPLDCSANTIVVEVTSGDLNFGNAVVGTGNGVLPGSPLTVKVTEGCGFGLPWDVDVAATNFTLGAGLTGLDISSNNLYFAAGGGGVGYTMNTAAKDIYGVVSAAGLCTAPAAAAIEAELKPIASSGGVGASILVADSTITCSPPIPTRVGAPGVTTGSWDTSLDLLGEFVGYNPFGTSTYTSNLTVSVGPIV